MGLGALPGFSRVKGLRVLGAGRTLELDFPRLSNFADYGLVRRRLDLDDSLAKAAQSHGAVYFTGTEAAEGIFEGGSLSGVRWVSKQKVEGGGVEVADSGEHHAPFTIIADGASSSFGRSIGLVRRANYPMGLAIRTYYASPRSTDDFFESWLQLRKGDDLLPGYGWIFPMEGGVVNVGVGVLTTFGKWRDVNLAHLQRAFVDMLPRDYGITHESQTEPYKSGRLPMGGGLAKPYGKGFVVIGDAAGMVNPFNGEGIAYALETGKLASSIIASALANGKSNDLPEYRVALHDTYAAYYRFGRKFVSFIGHPLPFTALVQVGMRSKTLMQFVLQVLGNLAETKGGRASDYGFRAAMKLAEHKLPELTDPDISSPPIPRSPINKAGAA
jgi:flavin-dependent dehydrogenase